VAEAARIEGCGLPTLYWRIHQARKELRKRLARYLDA
jgi:DNA-directed RNA polymerase specialized sigma24 family protein